MFNSRDEKLELGADFYNPYKVGNYVENIHTKQIAKIINTREEANKTIVILQTNIRHATLESIIEISYKELTNNWTKTNQIIITRMPTEKERLHLGISFKEDNFFSENASRKLKK